MTTNGALGGINDTAPSNRIEISGAGAGYDGVFNINANSLANGNQTFSYDNPGSDSALDAAVTVTLAGRDNGGKETITTQTAHGLSVGDVIVVDLANTTFNNGGNPAPAGTAKRRAADQTVVDGAGGPCSSTSPPCTVEPWTDGSATGAFGFKTVNCLSTAFCAGGPLNEILSSTTTQSVSATSAKPVEYTVPGGVPHAPLNPGTYYGGLCIGNSPGKSCGVKVGGSCLTSSTMLNTTLTMNPGVYIMAGGGFHVCGNTMLIAKGVMIYNTVDSLPLAVGANTKAAELGQVKFNTNGEVFMTGVRTNPYKGMVIFQGTDPNPTPAAYDPVLNPYKQLTTAKCDNRNVNLTDIALIHMGTNGLGNPSIPDSGISGTIYAPAQHALFRDTVSGENTLAIITGCIFIDGANSTFNYDSSPGGPLAGTGTGLDE